MNPCFILRRPTRYRLHALKKSNGPKRTTEVRKRTTTSLVFDYFNTVRVYLLDKTLRGIQFKMAAPIKMDELLVSWLGSDDVYENVLNLIEKYRVQRKQQQQQQHPDSMTPPTSPKRTEETGSEPSSPRAVFIPPFYPLKTSSGTTIQRRRSLPRQSETWEPPKENTLVAPTNRSNRKQKIGGEEVDAEAVLCVRDQVLNILPDLQIVPTQNIISFPLEAFVRITKEVCSFPFFFNASLYQRILNLWNKENPINQPVTVVTLRVLEWFWKNEMEPFDPSERFFRLIKQPDQDCILRDDFLPYIKALLNDHPVSSIANNEFTPV